MMCDMESMEVMKSRHKELESKYEKQLFRVENIRNDSNKLKFFTGFSTFATLMVCFNSWDHQLTNFTTGQVEQRRRVTKGGQEHFLL